MTAQPLLTEKTKTADAVLRVLEEAGIEMVFGMAGGHTGRIFVALAGHQNTIRTLMVREESLAGVMAEVYGRLTRKPGVIIGQGPWVLGNGLIGTMEALLSSSPMLLLTDFSDSPGYNLHGPYQAGVGGYGVWDARAAFGGVTKEVFEANDPVTAVQATQFAIKHAMSGQPGPVAVLYGHDGLAGSIQPETRPRLYATGPYLPVAPPPADPARVTAAARVIAKAKRPVLIAGNGVRIAQAYEALAAFAEEVGVPVVTTASGKGTFAETHPLALGVFGTFGIPAANAYVASADLVIAVGSKLGASDTARANPALLDPARQTFIQVEVEPRNASWTFPADHVLIGDAARVLVQLREAFEPDASRREVAEGFVAAARADHGYFDVPAYASDAAPILPQRVIGELRANLPEDSIVTCDAGENRILMTHFYQTQGPGGFLQAAGAGPMGFAIPAAMAAKLVHPERAVVAVCGDGGFAMTMNGLMSALEHNIPIVVVIFNNHALGWVLHGGGPFAAEFNDFDHAAIARAMGCNGVRISDPADLGAAIREAIGAGKPTVIDVLTSLDVSFRDVTSPLAL
ncbi:thiamine pyrophosphate-binding protein [Zavarzinia sp. CC-PAN008]|uniref:thiamine pyrophosphate-binding protein n=1 Tax=Zavarzinia sp. CC-PAN008 TaxID=3243332 RepID=UPI003F743237